MRDSIGMWLSGGMSDAAHAAPRVRRGCTAGALPRVHTLRCASASSGARSDEECVYDLTL